MVSLVVLSTYLAMDSHIWGIKDIEALVSYELFSPWDHYTAFSLIAGQVKEIFKPVKQSLYLLNFQGIPSEKETTDYGSATQQNFIVYS